MNREHINTIEDLKALKLWPFMNRYNLYSIGQRQVIFLKANSLLYPTADLDSSNAYVLKVGEKAYKGKTPSEALRSLCNEMVKQYPLKFRLLVGARLSYGGNIPVLREGTGSHFLQVGNISAFISTDLSVKEVTLKEIWKSITGLETVKEWCTVYEAPILWIIPNELQKPVTTLIDVQRSNHTVDAAVKSAINSLRNMDSSILTDKSKVEAAFLATVGNEYEDIWSSEHSSVIAKAKMKFGNDMSNWSITDLSSLQKMLKHALQEKAKKEKLAGTKDSIRKMQDSILRDRVTAFLDVHPEFCDDFTE